MIWAKYGHVQHWPWTLLRIRRTTPPCLQGLRVHDQSFLSVLVNILGMMSFGYTQTSTKLTSQTSSMLIFIPWGWLWLILINFGA